MKCIRYFIKLYVLYSSLPLFPTICRNICEKIYKMIVGQSHYLAGKKYCIRCGYCYSCHWKKEKEEKEVLNNRISEIFPSSLISTRKNRLIEKEVEQQQSLSEQRHQQHLIVDVYGRASEPICTYHRCSHKFSSWFRQLQV
jgi:hypothetical protein